MTEVATLTRCEWWEDYDFPVVAATVLDTPGDYTVTPRREPTWREVGCYSDSEGTFRFTEDDTVVDNGVTLHQAVMTLMAVGLLTEGGTWTGEVGIAGI